MSLLECPDIYFRGKGQSGKVRFATSGLGWKASDGAAENVVVTIRGDEIKSLQWMRVARHFQLRISTHDRQRIMLENFAAENFEKIQQIAKEQYHLALEVKETSLKGWNWGKTEITGKYDNIASPTFADYKIPLSSVANSNIAGKEVTIEFATVEKPGNDASDIVRRKANKAHELTEMRLWIPGDVEEEDPSDDDNSTDEEALIGSDGEILDKPKKKSKPAGDAETPMSLAQQFHSQLKEMAETDTTLDPIVTFADVICTTPRGNYDIEVFEDHMRLRGKTYDYKILMASIKSLFILPKSNEQHVQLLIGLDPPMRQGLTRYPYLVLQFAKDDALDQIELNIEPEILEKYEGKLQKIYKDELAWQLIMNVFKTFSGRRVASTGPGSMKTHDDQYSIKANLKAVQGEMYFLERGIMFSTKQPVYTPYNDIHSVVFSRLFPGASTVRTIDMKVITLSGPEHPFSALDRSSHQEIEQWLRDKKIRVKNEKDQENDLLGEEISEEESDANSAGRKNSKPAAANGEDDYDESEDEDFKGGSGSASSSSSSDSESDGAEVLSDASGDKMVVDSGKAERKKKKAADEGSTPPVKKKKKVAKEAKDA